jgi:hypothetical protein
MRTEKSILLVQQFINRTISLRGDLNLISSFPTGQLSKSLIVFPVYYKIGGIYGFYSNNKKRFGWMVCCPMP